MSTPLYKSDVKKPSQLPDLPAPDDQDVLVVEKKSEGKLKGTKFGDLKTAITSALQGLVNALQTDKIPYQNADKPVNLNNKDLLNIKNLQVNEDTDFGGIFKGNAPNILAMETLGHAPRNLMEVYGTATVAETFEAVRADILLNGFKNLRLGGYIDLDTFTVNNWYNGVAGTTAGGAWDTTKTVTKGTNNSTRVEIVSFDDYYNVGENGYYPTEHHAVFMFSEIPLQGPMHKLNSYPWYQTSQHYKGSDLVTKGLVALYNAIQAQFGTAKPYEVSRYIATLNEGEHNGPERLFIPTGMNIFGSTGFSYVQRSVSTQRHFALFALKPSRIMKTFNGVTRQRWWLAEPSAGSSSNFTTVNNNGTLTHGNSYHSFGVVPAFLI
jgi:hypothetical protein